METSFFYIHKTSSKTNAPLILLLHGYGSNEEDLFSFSTLLPKDATIISLRAPLSLFPNSYAWYNIYYDGSVKNYDIQGAKQIRNKLIDELDYFIDKYNCDSKRISIIGFSQGAILGHGIVQCSNSKIKNLVALSGYVEKDLLCLKKNNSSIYISHGTNDEVIPYNESIETNKILDDNNIDYVFESFDQGHGVNQENLKSFLDWLYKKY